MAKNRVVSPRLLVPSGSLDEDTEVTDEPGSMIEYNPSLGKPEWEQAPHEPSSVQREIEQLLRDFEDISHQHEVTNGKAPPGVRSGVGIQFLQEQDDTVMAPTINGFENSLERWAKFILKLIKQNYIEPRIIDIVGENNVVEAFEFKGSDLDEAGCNDVLVVAGSAMPQSKVLRQNFILGLVDRQIITDPQLILKLLEFGDIEEVYEDLSVDVNKANLENKKFAQGDLSVVTREFFNHEIHIKRHNYFRKTEEYEQLPQEIQDFVDAHVEEHGFYLEQQALQAMANVTPPAPMPQGQGIPDNRRAVPSPSSGVQIPQEN
jgi:hypothetical protein